MGMPIKDKSLQHTNQLAPFGSLQRLLALIEVIVSYNDDSAFEPLLFPVSTSKVYAGMKHKNKRQEYANYLNMINDMI